MLGFSQSNWHTFIPPCLKHSLYASNLKWEHWKWSRISTRPTDRQVYRRFWGWSKILGPCPPTYTLHSFSIQSLTLWVLALLSSWLRIAILRTVPGANPLRDGNNATFAYAMAMMRASDMSLTRWQIARCGYCISIHHHLLWKTMQLHGDLLHNNYVYSRYRHACCTEVLQCHYIPK